MKKTVLYIAAVPVFLFLLWIWVGIGKEIINPYKITTEDITVEQEVFPNANQYQENAYVDIMSFDGMLYIRPMWADGLARERFMRKLCTVENGKMKALSETVDRSVWYDDRFVYYVKDGISKYKLKAYDLQLKETSTLLEFERMAVSKWIADPDGTLRFFPAEPDSDTGTGYIVRDGELLGPFENMPFYTEYEINGKRYSIRGLWNREIYCDDTDISEQFGNSTNRTLIPYRDGLIFHNDGVDSGRPGRLVYYIQSDGTITPLFPEFPCMDSESCVNFHENYVYLSFDRWEKWGGTIVDQMVGFENDTLVGTYRINMDDYSVEKISDNIYNGMFIFDDSGIYACNNDGDIHHIDFDGNLIRAIVD